MTIKQYSMGEFDVFFLSYDEPNAEKHWANLENICPWAKRVHGVKGFDAAHRACAEQSTTDWFVTVDADNIVDPAFFDQQLMLDGTCPVNCYSWDAENAINGLVYGNGGLKLWKKSFVLSMNSHENSADNRSSVDFCWEDGYQQIHKVYSKVWNNGSPLQAFRVAFREGVKLVLNRGERIPGDLWQSQLSVWSFRSLKIWATIGSDVENGEYSLIGTRMAMWKMLDDQFDYTAIRDYDWFNTLWETEVAELIEDANLCAESYDDTRNYWENLTCEYDALIQHGSGIALPYLNGPASAFFKEMISHAR